MHPAGKREILRSQACTSNPRGKCVSRLLGNLELRRALGLLLHDDRSRGHVLAVRDIANPQLDQIARSKLTVDGQIEQGQVPGTVGQLKSNPNRPDVLEFEGGLLAHELAFVPQEADLRGLRCTAKSGPSTDHLVGA
jgi:hypothetical protein